jgi:hypothetical protein
VVVFVSVVSPTTTVCGSFVGAVGGGGAASSVVLSIVTTGTKPPSVFVFVLTAERLRVSEPRPPIKGS